MKPVLKAVALMGATATGKSSLALQLAAGRSCIISCDSMQVYRHLDIGTAKPDPEEQSRVPHHLIDCCDLPAQFSAALWARQAEAVIRRENKRGRRPLIVGGTGLYLKALIEGFADIPDEDPEVRRELLDLQRQYGTPYLHGLLAQCDAVMAARLAPGDSQRVLRALAVFRSSGKPLSQWQAQGKHRQQSPAVDCPVFVLEIERDCLRQRLAERFHAMLDAGWLDEVRWLDSLKLESTHPALRAVGYRQLLQHVHGELTLDEAVRMGITATRKYAKRQLTWFRHQTADAVRGDADMLAPLILEALDG